MIKTLLDELARDKDYPLRTHIIDIYTRVLNGTVFSHLPYPFNSDYENGKYIPLSKRRPSVNYNLCKLVVDDGVSLLFGSDHFPTIETEDKYANETLNDIIASRCLEKIMIDGATTGSVGSVVFLLSFRNGKIFIEVKSTQYLTPTFSKEDPEVLDKLVERYKVIGKMLQSIGLPAEDKNNEYWYEREWNKEQEICYKPYKASLTPEEAEEQKEVFEAVDHKLGFVPALWEKNLDKPGCHSLWDFDGASTFAPAVDIYIELCYQMSQAGRALRYCADPTVVFKVNDDQTIANNATETLDLSMNISGAVYKMMTAPSSGTKGIVRSSSNALVLGPTDDAKLLEISGKSTEAVIEYAKFLREMALESIHGNRANADRVNAAQSGKAMQAMNQPLIWLADRLRITYGGALVRLLKMIISASHKADIYVNNKKIKPLNLDAEIKLIWPHWYPNTPEDKEKAATTLGKLKATGLISQKSAVEYIAADFAISDVEEELNEIGSDISEQEKREADKATHAATLSAKQKIPTNKSK